MMAGFTDEPGKVVLALVVVMAVVATAVFFSGAPGFPGDGDTRFNRADVMFMTMMIPHHEQAIEMAEMAPERTDNEKILALSENISTAQRQENRQMTEWLEEAGYSTSGRTMRMAGMATPQEMEELEQSRGEEFDRLFAELMIEHHEGGIHMANMVIQNGKSERVSDLAQGMVETQRKEINQMKEWRNLSKVS